MLKHARWQSSGLCAGTVWNAGPVYTPLGTTEFGSTWKVLVVGLLVGLEVRPLRPPLLRPPLALGHLIFDFAVTLVSRVQLVGLQGLNVKATQESRMLHSA